MRDEAGALWLAKFPSLGDPIDVARAESCTLELARRCGLAVPEVRCVDIGHRPAMLIRRFDRYWALPPVRRLHLNPGGRAGHRRAHLARNAAMEVEL